MPHQKPPTANTRGRQSWLPLTPELGGHPSVPASQPSSNDSDHIMPLRPQPADITVIVIHDGHHKNWMEVTVPCLYRRGPIVVHETSMPRGFRRSFPCDFTVSNEPCGLAYRTGFRTEAGARLFADYIASVPELTKIKQPSDVRILKRARPQIGRAMRERYNAIRRSEIA